MSNYAIPEELTFDMLSRMYPSVKSEYRRQPFNAQSFSPGNMVQVGLNKMDKSFANPATLALRFNATLTYTTGATAATGANSSVNVLGSAWSIFSRYVSKQSGGNDIDQIDFPGRLVNAITNMTLTHEEKRHMVSMGYNEQHSVMTNLGWGETVTQDANTSTSRNISFVIPLIGALNASKLIPLFAGDMELNLTVAQIADSIRTIGNITVSALSVNNVELIAEVLTLEEAGFQQLLQMHPGVINLKTSSYAYAAGQSIGGANPGPSGTFDTVVPFSLNSLKQFIWWASPSDSFNGNFDGVNPNLTNYQLFIGSTAYPQQPVKCDSVAELYYQNSKSFGAFYSAGHSGSANRSAMSKASTAGGEYVAYDTTALPFADRLLNANKFYCCLDLEIINQLKNSLYSGISTRGSTNTLRLNIGRALKASTAVNIHMYACYDVVLNFDYVNGKITYSN
jgi:hypothetical protein